MTQPTHACVISMPIWTPVTRFQSSLNSCDSRTRGISLQNAADRNERNRLEAFLALIGLRLRERNRRFTVERRSDKSAAERAQLLQRIGVDLTDVVAQLNRGDSIRLEIPSDTVPIPLSRSVWETAVFRRKTPNLVPAILGDRGAALLCHGLASVDDETLVFLGANAELLKRLSKKTLGCICSFRRKSYSKWSSCHARRPGCRSRLGGRVGRAG